MESKYTAQLLMGNLNEDWLGSMDVYPVYMPRTWSVLFYNDNEPMQHVKKLKLDPLGNQIKLLHPGVISYSLSEDTLKGNKPWLYIKDKLDYLEELQELIKEWFLWVHKQKEIDNLVQLMKFQLSYGSKLSVDEIKENDNLIEGLLTRFFCQETKTFNVLETKEKIEREIICDFRSSFSGRRHEAICVPIELKKDYFSFVITFNSTVDPITKEKRITIHPSIRRWQRDTKKSKALRLNPKKKHSLYVLDKEVDKSSFFRFQIRSMKLGDNKFKPVFCYNHEYIFNKVVREKYQLEEIVKNPKSLMDLNDFFIGVPYGNSTFGGSHRVGAGIEPQLKKALYGYFMDNFHPVDLIKPVTVVKDEGIQEPADIFPKSKGRRTIDFGQIDYKGKTEFISLHVWSDNEILMEAVIDVLDHSFLSFEKFGAHKYLIHAANNREVVLAVKNESLNDIDRKMDNDSHASQKNRMDEVLNLLDKRKWTKGTYHLIQIPAYEHDDDQTGDPKEIIRKAFALKEMKTQFIHPMEIPDTTLQEEKKNEIWNSNHIRLEKALFDIFAKSGFVGSMNEFKFNLYVLDVFKFQDEANDDSKIHYLPIVSCCTSEKVGYYLLGSKQFVYQDDLLAHIGAIKNQVVTKLNWYEIERSLIELLKSDKHGHKILTVSAGVRRYFDHLQNNNFSLDHHLLNHVPNLSLCRYNVGWDVPGYYLFDHKKEETVKTKGIFKIHDHLYYGVGQKPDSDSKGKWETRFTSKSAKFQDRKLAEMLIASNESVDLIEIAKVVQNSRDINITTNFHGKFDYCLNILSQLKEYMEEI